MMRFSVLLLPTCLSLLIVVTPGRSDHEQKPAAGKATLFSEVGRHHHPIRTDNCDAQHFFDQGMTFLYGFNHADAVRSFERAAELDPKAAMPHWGIAMALGPNYNRDMDPIDEKRYKAAREAASRAVELAKGGPAHEKAYAEAVLRRYSPEVKAEERRSLEEDYSEAMRKLWRSYPDDLDAGTLYADSLMVLRPWQLWAKDGTPAPDADKILEELQEVLRRDPDHIGANHLYIHAIEASPWPERGLPSAASLLKSVPWQGHLTHMPAHIYIRTGDNEMAAQANLLAIKADESLLDQFVPKSLYGMMYYPHNVHFLAHARTCQGKFEEALAAAEKLVKLVEPAPDHMPGMEPFVQMPMQMLLRFHRWDDVLKVPAPPEKRLLSRAFRHYARTVALCATRKQDAAREEFEAFEALRKKLPADAPWASNSAEKVLTVASLAALARLEPDPEKAIKRWEKAVEAEDALNYGEPPDWYYPVRESLGSALLRTGRAEEAEQVFRKDLRRNRRNPRSLFGLRESLKAQEKGYQADLVDREFRRAWGQGPPPRLEDL